MKNNFENNQLETMNDIYNRYGIINEGIFEKSGIIYLSEDLQEQGWKVGPSFRETNDHVKFVRQEIEKGKHFYDFKIGFINDAPFTHTRCLLFRDKEKK